jgi:hypothetical protein
MATIDEQNAARMNHLVAEYEMWQDLYDEYLAGVGCLMAQATKDATSPMDVLNLHDYIEAKQVLIQRSL